MDEKDMVNGLPSVDDTVSDMPPEPEHLEREPKEESSDGGEDAGKVSLQKGQPEPSETSGGAYHHGEEDWQASAQAGAAQRGYDSGAGGHGYSQGQQGAPPPGYGYSGGPQGTPPPGYSYGSGNGQGYGSQGYGPQGYQPYRAPKKNNNNMALASLIVGVLSILLCCCGGFGIILGAVGIVLAILSRGREPMETSAKVGCGLSIGGIVLGIVVLIMAFAVVGSEEFRSDLYQRSYGDHGGYSHYFDYDGM